MNRWVPHPSPHLRRVGNHKSQPAIAFAFLSIIPFGNLLFSAKGARHTSPGQRPG